MNIPDKVLKKRLQNVYFIWGRGKTTVADLLRAQYHCAVYSTDDSRDPHREEADPADEPYMCRDFEAEYGVTFWELPKEVIAKREAHWLSEMTPMIIADLLLLAGQHDCILCEGYIDYDAAAKAATHMVYLWNRASHFDWFDRPDHADALDSIRNRTDIGEDEKAHLIEQAYQAVAVNEECLPDWVTRLGIPVIAWDDTTTPEQTARDAAALFGLDSVG